jgi:hypothetical protein
MGLVSGPKKTGQLIAALGALVVLVFGVTFAVISLGSTGRTDPLPGPGSGPGPEPGPSLYVPERKFPADDQQTLEWEAKKPGFHDFWFENKNDQQVKVGLNTKNCTCSSVELVSAPPDAPIKPEMLKDKAKMQALEAKFKPVPLEHGETVVVPAGATGWVRLRWSGAKPIDRLVAELWTTDKANGDRIKLETLVTLLGAMLVDSPTREKDVGVVRAGGGANKVEIIVFSCTRDKLTLRKPEAVEEQALAGKPFTVSEAVAVSAEEREKLDKEFQGKGLPSHVKCAYRITVTVRERSEDGKEVLDIGPFRRHVRIASDDEDVDPIEVVIAGTVEGEVAVLGAEQGRVLLNNFSADRGKQQTVTLQADSANIDLTVDNDKTSKFIKAALSAPKKDSFGRNTWRMTIEVPPNKITGAFPRADDPELRDSAIYLWVKTKDAPARRIRIPVQGIASS